MFGWFAFVSETVTGVSLPLSRSRSRHGGSGHAWVTSLSLSLVIQIRGVDMSSSSSTVYGASFLVSNKQVFDGSDPHRSRLVFHWLDV
jgi:hypothetical protein